MTILDDSTKKKHQRNPLGRWRTLAAAVFLHIGLFITRRTGQNWAVGFLWEFAGLGRAGMRLRSGKLFRLRNIGFHALGEAYWAASACIGSLDPLEWFGALQGLTVDFL